jgi:hypothetical protein
LVFFDDILVYSATFEDHLSPLYSVLELLQADLLKVKLPKCAFVQTKIPYLGHVISQQGVASDTGKISVVAAWPTPNNVKELRSFLGLAEYYKKFVKNFGVISRPLSSLLKKNTVYVWTEEHESTFAALKQALVSAPIFALPNFEQPFIIETDANNGVVGAVLMQGGHPLAFLSNALGVKSKRPFNL